MEDRHRGSKLGTRDHVFPCSVDQRVAVQPKTQSRYRPCNLRPQNLTPQSRKPTVPRPLQSLNFIIPSQKSNIPKPQALTPIELVTTHFRGKLPGARLFSDTSVPPPDDMPPGTVFRGDGVQALEVLLSKMAFAMACNVGFSEPNVSLRLLPTVVAATQHVQ